LCCCYPSKGTSMTDEALRLALEALTVLLDEWTPARQAQLKGMEAVTAIKAALEAKDEPVAWMNAHDVGFKKSEFGNTPTIPLYTTPPQRTWVGLTDEDEIDWEEGGNLKDLVKAIEAKLKEKNT